MHRLKLSLVVALLAALTVAAPAQAGVKNAYTRAYYHVKHVHGVKAPGRNIRRAGVKIKHHGVRPATTADFKRSTRTLKRMLYRGSTLLNPSTPRVPPAGTATLRATSPPLTSIAACESGGNPRAVSSNDAYRGKYQFDYGTWATVGGSGDPAAAPEAEQDMRAAMLYARRGSAPWPVCGR